MLAGGFGTRLGGHLNGLPKPMIPVGKRPFLEFVLDKLVKAGFCKVCLAVSYKAEIIRSHFKDAYKGLGIVYSYESTPLGTGGGIKKAMGKLDSEEIFVLNGDTLVDIDYKSFLEFHNYCQSDLTVATYEMENCDRYGAIKVDKNNRIIKFVEKMSIKKGRINAGVYLINKSIFDYFDLPDEFSFETDFMENNLGEIEEYAFLTVGRFVDIGVPEDLEKARGLVGCDEE